MRRRRTATSILLPLALVTTVLSSCEGGVLTIRDEGSGVLVTETRDVGDFTSIEVSAALNLDLTVDPEASPSVNVTFDDNLIDNVLTRVEVDTLILEVEGSYNLIGSGDRRIAVSMTALESLEASGATDVEISGEAPSYRLIVSGASDVDAEKLQAGDVEVEISGASSVDLAATGTVSGNISGASNLRVYGEPASVLVDSSGASSVDIRN
jgi:hypothetical protein